jgi:flagellar hook assembly protein FlgD
MEVNPINQTHSQLEQYHFNNILRIPFHVVADKINPLLDVTFDGVHILNNDIVSAKPNILVKLKDENQFLALNDTSAFHLFLQTPSNSVAQRIYFGNTLTFIPATLPNNSCKINYTPVYSQDGTYQLIIQAKDRTGNQSGAIDYKINFEIINKATITEVMNYPNPFSTSTRFVFTLTGSEIPSNFKIQIMTITGKVVREIFQDELGAIHIGRNITDYAWDGKDEFGDKLANGVYLYRVITKLNGEDIEKLQTDADQYFKKGWGKMYLMR